MTTCFSKFGVVLLSRWIAALSDAALKSIEGGDCLIAENGWASWLRRFNSYHRSFAEGVFLDTKAFPGGGLCSEYL